MGLVQLVNSNTRNENILDLLFTNNEQIVIDYKIVPPFCTSDHDSMQYNLVGHTNKYQASVQSAENIKYVWSKADWLSLLNYCANIDWNSVFIHCTTANDCWICFTDILHVGIAHTVPFVCCNTSKRKYHSKAVDRLISRKRTVWRKKRDNPTPDNVNLYNQICKDVKIALDNERSIREMRVINSGNLGSFYRHVNSRLSHRSSIPPLRNSNGELSVSDVDKAETLSEYFSGVGVIDNDITPSLDDIETHSSNSNDVASLNFVYFDFYSVLKNLCQMKPGAAGPDGLPPMLFKNLSQVLASPLSILFNIILQFGEVPSLWKTASVVPIFKKGDTSVASNYRPVSLTSSCCKLFEATVKTNLLQFFLSRNLISSSQHGFLAKRSTSSNLLEALNDWTSALNSYQDSLVVFVDFAKAFDSVSVTKLLCKLSTIGVGGILLSWIKSFLMDISQRVKIGDVLSVSRQVRSGVPQGSVIGPVLFILFVNDIIYSLPPVARSKLFADDVKSYITVSGNTCITNFSLILEAISCWAAKWQLPLSVSKCGWMLISNRIYPVNCHLIWRVNL